jgi:hypothetical protein
MFLLHFLRTGESFLGYTTFVIQDANRVHRMRQWFYLGIMPFMEIYSRRLENRLERGSATRSSFAKLNAYETYETAVAVRMCCGSWL